MTKRKIRQRRKQMTGGGSIEDTVEDVTKV